MDPILEPKYWARNRGRHRPITNVGFLPVRYWREASPHPPTASAFRQGDIEGAERRAKFSRR